MELEAYFEFCGANSIRIKGHRIELEHLIDLYHDGFSPEVIAHELPSLKLEVIYAAITYYLHNKKTVDDYMALRRTETERLLQQYDSQPASPAIERLRKLREQLQVPHQ